MPFSACYPFSALVGQDDLKLALLLNAVNPRIGGVLILGEKGTAKSTAVRGLAALLPPLDQGTAVARPTPLVTLPLNASEDRLCGGIDFEAALRSGRPAFQPGLLAAADRGILYVDEVNLLDDHLVDLLLTAAASGENRVEREGVSFVHPARFLLVGTMNPEEGQLRPQLLDRFGLCVSLEGLKVIGDRLLLLERRETFDADPAGFHRQFAPENATLAERLAAAQARLPGVRCAPELRRQAAELALSQGVAGHRADLVLEQTTRALAAWEQRDEVTADDLRRAAELALPHRRRDMPPTPPPQAQQPQEKQPQEPPEESRQEPPPAHNDDRPQQPAEPPPADGAGETEPPPEGGDPGDGGQQVFAPGEPFQVRRIQTVRDRQARQGSGRRSRSRSAQKQGRTVCALADPEGRDLALDATLRAAAPHQLHRTPAPGLAVTLKPQDLHRRVREKRIGHLVLFLVDASGSMGARGRMTAAKGAVLSLLLDAYQKRDRVALIGFRAGEAQVHLPPTASIERAARLLAELPTGGRTPLSAGLAKGAELVHSLLRRDPAARPIVVLLTDGKANHPLTPGAQPLEEALAMAGRWGEDRRILFLVVDTEREGLVRFQLAGQLANALGADYLPLENLRADSLLAAVRDRLTT